MALESSYVAQARRDTVLVALSLLGLPYLWCGNMPTQGGMDCSGFVQWVLAHAGWEPWKSRFPLSLDMTSEDLRAACAPLAQGERLQPADLVFYGKMKASHVMFVTATAPGDDEMAVEVIGQSKGDSSVTSVALALAKGARVRTFSRANYRSDFLCVRHPWLRAA